MITAHQGNLLDSGAHTLVNPANCVGVMGAGLAKAFKIRYPGIYARYRILCQQGVITPGSIMFDDGDGQHIANMATKDHWQLPSQLTWIDEGLQTLARHITEEEVPSVGLPRIGCGLGGLRFEDVWPLMTRYLGPLDCDIRLYTMN